MSWENAHNYPDYVAYRRLKPSLTQDTRTWWKGLSLFLPAALYFIEILVCHQHKTLRETGTLLAKRLRPQNVIQAFRESTTVCSSDVPRRKDHLRMMQEIAHQAGAPTVVIPAYHYVPFFNPLALARYYRLLSKALRAFHTTPMDRLFLAASFIYNRNLINTLRRAWGLRNTPEHTHRPPVLAGKQYVPLNSSAYTEALLTLFFAQQGAHTFHIFHGLFGYYTRAIANDVVNGDNILGQTVLAFSQAQKEALVHDFGLEPSRVQVAGHPKYPHVSIQCADSMRTALVMGGIPDYDSDFAALMPVLQEVAAQTGITFHVKLHPLSHVAAADIPFPLVDKSHSVQSLLASGTYDLAITHNTSTYYDALCYGVVPFRWALGDNIDYPGDDDKFHSAEELIQRIQKSLATPPAQKAAHIKQVVSYTFGAGMNLYKTYLCPHEI